MTDKIKELIENNQYQIFPSGENDTYVISVFVDGEGKFGLLNNDGSFQIPLIYDNIFIGGGIAIALERKSEYLTYHSPNFHDSYRGIYHFINIENGQTITTLKDENILSISAFSCGLAKVNCYSPTIKDEEVYYLNSKGEKLKFAIPPSNDSYIINAYAGTMFGNNLAGIDIGNRFNLFNNNGLSISSETAFTKVEVSRGDNPAICLEDGYKLYSLFDINGRITKPIFESINTFSMSGYAIFKSNNLFGLINKKGETILEPNFNDLKATNNEIIVTKENKKFGVMNLKGELIIPHEYANYCLPRTNANNTLFVKKGVNWRLINQDNDIIISHKEFPDKIRDIRFQDNHFICDLKSGESCFVDPNTFEIKEKLIPSIILSKNN